MSNWSTVAGTYTATGVVPGSTADVIFSTTTAPAQQSTVLGADLTLKSVTFNDSNAVTIGGSNTLTLTSTVATVGTGTAGGGSAITVTSAAASPTISANVVLGAGQTWNVASGKNLAVSGIVSGANTLTKADAGTVTLSGANTYSGTTTINGGTLALSGGNDRVKSGNTVSFDGGNGSTATLDIGSTSQTLGNITFPATGLTTSMTANVNGSGGTLTLGASDLLLGPVGNNAQGITFNMSGLSNFSYNGTSARTFRVGYQSSYGGNSNNTITAANVTLANSTNTITVGILAINDTGGSSGAGNALLHLGTTNTINANTINMGTGGRSGATFDFATGLTSPTVKIRGTDTTSAVTAWNLGQVSINGANATWTQLADFSAGTIDANVTTMNVGKADFGGGSGRGGTDNATVKVGATTGANFTVGTLNLGYINGSLTNALGAGASASGTFTLNSASGIVNASTINFAKNTIADTSGNSKSVTGIFNLTNGTLNATMVQKEPTIGGTASATVQFNWTTGTIGNIAGGDLSFTKVPITLLTTADHIFNISGSNTATLDATSVISGLTFGITKTGTGTLSLNAANTYTGPTLVSNGTLAISGSIGGGASPTNMTVNSGGTLLLSGTGTDRVKDTGAATVALAGGTIGFENTVNGGLTETLGALTLSPASTLDFGTGTTGNTLTFTDSTISTGFGLNVFNWSGSTYGSGQSDPGAGTLPGQDRLLFNTSPAFDTAQISFYSGAVTTSGFLGTGQAISFGGSQYEIVPIPEPTSTALLGSMVLLGLVGFRERRRWAHLARR